MAQEENQIQVILAELLVENRKLLAKKDELIAKLKERVGVEHKRDVDTLSKALRETDIGELLLMADGGAPEEKEAAEAKVLADISGIMQESRARLVRDILVGALGWHKEPEAKVASADLQETSEAEQKEQSEVKKSWDCICGHKNNRKKFCRNCGKPRSEGEIKGEVAVKDTWTCRQCGKSGNKANFCVACGCPREGEKTEATPPQPAVHDTEKPQVSLEKTQVMPVQETMIQTQVQVAPQRDAASQSAPPPVQRPVVQPQPQASSQSNNSSQGAIIAVIVILVCVLGFMGFKEISANSDTKPSSSYHSVAKNADSPQKPNEKSQPVAKTELSLGGMDLDEEVAVMFDKLGKEKSYENDSNGYAFYQYDGMKVGVKNGCVKAFVSDGANCSTKRGIHEGSTLQDVLNAYGSDAMRSSYDNLELYEYNFKSLTGEDGILRFAINSKGVVDYISVRIPEEQKIDKQALGNAAKNAVGTYHAKITKKDYRAAYDLLTPDMQNTMGAYENWVKGFKNTIESRITEIQVTNVQADRVDVSFILLARDKRPGGGVEENRFRSTATVVQEGGIWKIASVNNKKI